METLKQDFIRFADLHSWYKHLPLEGRDYYASLRKGEQMRYPFEPRVKDYEGQHWHFYLKRENTNYTEYGPIRLGPFLKAIVQDEFVIYRSPFHLIVSSNKNTFLSWIEQNYPEYKTFTLEDWDRKKFIDLDPDILDIQKKETDKYWVNLFNAIKIK